jgi:predicted enzyme related to lactoylglutathione lyase
MILKKVPYMTLMVSDQDKALDFYTNVIGFEKRTDNPTPQGRFLTVGVHGQDFEIVLAPGRPCRPDIAVLCTVEVEDLRTVVETLNSRGVKFETEILDFPWGSVARFQDPDGNRLQVREGRSEAAAA